ncbi:hypothetical protein L6773_00765 [Rhodohalobacter sp. WB101]|uniref:DUF5666 domain-containing protein n=2 Tax=Rhodohalobacter sulfatireducens TaxID=2911366 RepID=A0ABS9K8F0_9BACT|nr:hypothetical protein [Rhodohalobacter sulfatireducens]
MNIYFKVIGVLICVVFTLNISVFAQKGLGDSNGIARSGELPTIVMLDGTLDHIKTGPCEHTTGRAVIGTHLFIDTEESDELFNVHLGAAYALESFVANLEIGQKVEIQAFQTDGMKPLEFIAKEVTTDSRTLQLRDENLRPFWAGDRNLRDGRPFRRGYRW